ncbi:MAG: rhodanese-like domain-containing protein [Neisseria elongata]
MTKDERLPLIAPAEAAAKICEGALAADIRSRAEYRGGHIGGALSLPPERHRGKLPDNAAPCLIFYCLGGKRTAMAEAVLAELGRGRECYILEGGLQAWKAAGLPVEADRAAPDIMRQVQTIAGGLILFGVLVGWLVSPWFYLINAAVGAGLLTAGLTGFCGMARLLANMPWNR